MMGGRSTIRQACENCREGRTKVSGHYDLSPNPLLSDTHRF
jgi:hypothetical protein